MLNENQPQIESDETPQGDTDVSLTTAEPTPAEMVKFWRWQRQQEIAADEADRNNMWVRLYSTILIRELKNLLQETAGELRAKLDKHNNIFEIDKLGEILLWQLSEFISQTHYDRTDEVYLEAVRYTQLDSAHAEDWFDVEVWERDDITQLRAYDRSRNDLNTPYATLEV